MSVWQPVAAENESGSAKIRQDIVQELLRNVIRDNDLSHKGDLAGRQMREMNQGRLATEISALTPALVVTEGLSRSTRAVMLKVKIMDVAHAPDHLVGTACK